MVGMYGSAAGLTQQALAIQSLPKGCAITAPWFCRPRKRGRSNEKWKPAFLPAFAAEPNVLLAFFRVEALVGVMGLAVIPAVNSLLKDRNEGWISFGGNLAQMGYGVSAVGYMLSIARLPAIVHKPHSAARKTYPRWLAILGIVVAIPHLLIPIGAYFKVQAILMAALFLGLVLPGEGPMPARSGFRSGQGLILVRLSLPWGTKFAVSRSGDLRWTRL